MMVYPMAIGQKYRLVRGNGYYCEPVEDGTIYDTAAQAGAAADALNARAQEPEDDNLASEMDDLASSLADLTGIPCPVISYGMEVLPA